MTRAEYLEAIQEGQQVLANQQNAEAQGVYAEDPRRTLFDTPEVCRRLKQAHDRYCQEVAGIFGIDLTYREEGGPPQTQLQTVAQALDG